MLNSRHRRRGSEFAGLIGAEDAASVGLTVGSMPWPAVLRLPLGRPDFGAAFAVTSQDIDLFTLEGRCNAYHSIADEMAAPVRAT